MLIMWISPFSQLSSQKTRADNFRIHVIDSACDVYGAGMKKTADFDTVFLSTMYPLFFQLYNKIIHQCFHFNTRLYFVFNLFIGVFYSRVVILAVYLGNGFIRQVHQLAR